MQSNTQIKRGDVDRELERVKAALQQGAQASSGDGVYFFIWGGVTLLVQLNWFIPQIPSLWFGIALQVAGWVLTMLWARRQRDLGGPADGLDRWKPFIFWMVVVTEIFVVSFIFGWAISSSSPFAGVIQMLILGGALIVLGVLSDLRVAAVGFAELLLATILPAFFSSEGLLRVGLLCVSLSFFAAGAFFYVAGRQARLNQQHS